MKNGTVVIRSSGTAEDLSSATFAGMYKTFLGIRDTENGIKAIIKYLGNSVFKKGGIIFKPNGYKEWSNGGYYTTSVNPRNKWCINYAEPLFNT